MLLGIDVGGTFTDAVVIKNGSIIAQAKTPTSHGNLLYGVMTALDDVLTGLDIAQLDRVALSTTIVTNAMIEGCTDKVGLLVMSGPGLDITGLVPEQPLVLSGYVDHRGRVVAAPKEEEVAAACKRLADRPMVAVSGKFAVRNPVQELEVADWVEKYSNPGHVTLGSSLSGSLNFWRRTNSAYYNAAVWRTFGRFADAIEAAIRERDICAPIYILKADGGTIPIAAARHQPVEAIFTGPAASVLGIMALTTTQGEVVSLDIGGTTTDIALWKNGVPLSASGGASIAGYPTAVRSFWLKSVGVGGDSHVRYEQGQLKIGPGRLGPAMAMGGPAPTITDALVAEGIVDFGDCAQANAAMRQLAAPGQDEKTMAHIVLDEATRQIYQAIEDMLAEHRAAPVYKVDDIVHAIELKPEQVIGVGGAALGLAPLVARKLDAGCVVPPGAMVANAVGAAVARPTLEVTVRADTAQGNYTVAELSLRRALPRRQARLADVRALAHEYLVQRATEAGVEVSDVETVYEEEFNLVRGFSTTGRIITCQQQIKPGVVASISGRGE